MGNAAKRLYNIGMQMIVYAGGEFVTGDDIANALLEYSRALGAEDAAEIVEIPILEADGSSGTAKFLIGPASQIVCKSFRTDFEELVDAAVVARLRRLSRGVSFPEAAQFDVNERAYWATMSRDGELS
jgi:hypothetical protein